jgi:hypothetical protein
MAAEAVVVVPGSLRHRPTQNRARRVRSGPEHLTPTLFDPYSAKCVE